MSEYHSRLVPPHLPTVQRVSASQTSHRHPIYTVHEKKSITGNGAFAICLRKIVENNVGRPTTTSPVEKRKKYLEANSRHVPKHLTYRVRNPFCTREITTWISNRLYFRRILFLDGLSR